MMIDVRWILGTLWLIAGCSALETYWAPSPLPEAGAKSLVLVFGDGQGASFAWVSALLPNGKLTGKLLIPETPWLDDHPEQPRARALYFRSTLAELGLAEGRFPEGGKPQSCLLEHPMVAYETTPTHGTQTQWLSGSPALSLAEHDLLLGPEACVPANYCRQLDKVDVVLPTESSVDAIIAVSDREALVTVALGGIFYRVTRDGAITSTIHQGLPGVANARTPDGELWLGGASGDVVHGPVDGPFTRAPIPDLADFVVGAFGVEAATGRLLALSTFDPEGQPLPSEIAIHRFEGGQWRTLHRSEVADVKTSGADLVEYAPGRWMGSYGDQTIVTIDGDEVDKHMPSLGTLFGSWSLLAGLASIKAGEVYLGTSSGTLYVDRSGRAELELVDNIAFPSAIQAIEAYGDALFLGGGEGYFLEFHPNGKRCDFAAQLRTDVAKITRVGDDLVASGGRIRQESTVVSWITVR